MRTRTVTGLLIVLISLLAVSLHRYSFLILGWALLMAATKEYYQVTTRHTLTAEHYILQAFMGSLYVLVALGISGIIPAAALGAVVVAFGLVLTGSIIRQRQARKAFSTSISGGLYYAGLPWLFYPLAGFVPGVAREISLIPGGTGSMPFFSPQLILGFFILQWLFDTSAYLTGSRWGKHKMAPAISPRKSWEGFLGGTILTLISALFLHHLFPLLGPTHWFIAGIIIVFFGTAGDFYESALKRRYGVKDSGNLLPGHGGVLDRYDGTLFSLPAVITYVWLVKGITL